MNPYAIYLGTLNPLDVIASSPAELKTLLEKLGTDLVDEEPAPGKWSAREILCHLADCEIVFAFRIRQALSEERHVIQPFDQGRWAEVYRAYSAVDALAAFTEVRTWNLKLIRSIRPEAFQRALNHPERGDMTLQTVIETMGGHDRNHIGQIEAIAAVLPARV